MSVHFSSATCEWPTPQAFFDKLDAEFDFTLDVCANSDNAKCLNYFSVLDGSLIRPWLGRVWMNPPYGRGIKHWVEKAYLESINGCLVVCLLPARTDTKWFHDYCLRGEIRFIRGRLKFGSA